MNSRKYQRYFKPISSTSFSTAGTIRNQGRVGQTSLSRSLVHTPFKGDAPVGHGSNVQTGYPKSIVNSCNKSSNSDGQTNMTNKGVILSRVVNPTSVYNNSCIENPCNKPTFKNTSAEYHSSGSLTRRNVNQLMALQYNVLDGSIAKSGGNLSHPRSQPSQTVLQGPLPIAKNVAPMSSGDYIRTALPYKTCMDNAKEDCIVSGN
ncbi:MAG: hypothetical protein CMB96_04780 [Flavobacteriaceae bacterium]|nr:hypothetical protein [Flavobacteriaceae bacterium]|tara:strand:- start:1612 stop:2226 length:615 start_codon:yes stop_codon:yes gene_type:complete